MAVTTGSALRQKWQKQLDDSHKRFRDKIHMDGDKVIDQYRMEKSENTGSTKLSQDMYNILYSNTETIRPSLYGQTPKPVVTKTDADSSNSVSLAATLTLEKAITYQMDIQEGGFDTILDQVVEDYLLPGLGQVWMRYDPTLQGDEVEYEKVAMDYVFWKDFRCSRGRVWSEIWWVARCAWMDKSAFAKRFPDIAKTGKVSFNQSNSTTRGEKQDIDNDQVCVWEIWDKKRKQVIWYCDNYPDDVLDQQNDILKLKEFFPCPRPMRAVTTNNTIMPRSFYAQYKKQADELNDITHRIRLMCDGLRLVGIFDATNPSLAMLLKGRDNKMVPVDNWAMLAEKGGLKGTIDFFPITDVAAVLMQLYQARQEVKNEIYEITGWSDIIRGVSKASETLGAQQIKSDWAGARIKRMQREVQRFIRDMLRITGEIVSEHFQPATLMLITGLAADLKRAQPEEQQRMLQIFPEAVQLLKDERQRCALIDIETDSTIVADETADRQMRTEFVGSVGAFLQQAVPAMTAYPPVGPLLMDILSFSVKGFRAARPLQESFDQFTQMVKQGKIPPPQDPKAQQQPQGDDGAAKAQVQLQIEGMKQGTAKQELSQEQQQHVDEMSLKQQAENNRHQEAMQKLAVDMLKARILAQQVGLAAEELDHTKTIDHAQLAHDQQVHVDGVNQDAMQTALDQQGAEQDRQFQAEQGEADRAAKGGLTGI